MLKQANRGNPHTKSPNPVHPVNPCKFPNRPRRLNHRWRDFNPSPLSLETIKENRTGSSVQGDV
jgi:hypothetical protein